MDEFDLLFAKAAEAFSPGAPIDKYDLFSGRIDQIHDVINAVYQRGQHVILYGERGVGKTSLTKVLSEVLHGSAQQNVVFKHVNCDVNDTFSTIWHKVLREIQFSQTRQGLGFIPSINTQNIKLSDYIGKDVSPEDIRMLLQQFASKFVIAFDELDRIKDRSTTVLLTDTIKTLSDHSVDVTLLLVGVADNVDQLIEGHRSVERSLVQVHMPRMSKSELEEIITKATKNLGMTIQNKAKQKILKLSEGLPHYTHLLGLYAFQHAVQKKSLNVTLDNVQHAIETSIKKAQQSILHDYHQATSSSRSGVIYDRVLLACALAKTDELGYFAAADVREPLSIIMGKAYDIPAFARHLKDFCEQNRGPVLQQTGVARRLRYRFINPMLQPFVIMKGLDKGYIDDGMLTID